MIENMMSIDCIDYLLHVYRLGDNFVNLYNSGFKLFINVYVRTDVHTGV